MPTFTENINKLRAGSRESTRQAMQTETAAAQERGQAGIDHVRNIRNKLEPFSGHLRDWKRLDIAHQEKLGIQDARRSRRENLRKLTKLRESVGRIDAIRHATKDNLPENLRITGKESEEELKYKKKSIELFQQQHPGGWLSDEFESLEAQNDAYNRMAADIVLTERALTDTYPSAAALQKLNGHRLVGYAKEKLRLTKNSWPEQMKFWMANEAAEIEIKIAGKSFKVIPAEFNKAVSETDPVKRDKAIAELFKGSEETTITTLADVNRLQITEQILDIGEEKLRERLGLNQYKEEMLEITGLNETILNTKEQLYKAEVNRFIIANSLDQQSKSLINWNNSGKDSKALERLIIQTKWTTDQKGNLLGNSGALDFAFRQINKIGVENNNTGIADHYGSQPLPATLAQQLGVPLGTTWEQKWPSRFSELRTSIKAGYVKAVNAERDYQKAAGTELENRLTTEAREATLAGQTVTTDRVNWYKDQFGKLGLPIPESVLKFETASMRDARRDKGLIEALRDSQGGVITNQQLDQFHPSAAAEFRKEADAYEEGLLEDYNTENLIKAALDSTFTGMGLKGNEKNRIYQEAFKNAKIDYIKQYNKLRAMGFDEAHANYLALNGAPNEAKDKEGQPIVGFHGVLHEIESKGEGSKYVITGQNVQDSLGDAFVRVGYVNTAKKQIQKNPNSVTTGLLGGQYGQDQLNIIAANIEKYGLNKGLAMSDEAVDFYRGIANGTDLRSTGGWMGILDAQLKANIPNHQGLWASEPQPNAVSLLTGINADGQEIPDPTNLKPLTDQAMRAIANANTYPEFVYAIQLLQDAGYDTSSIFDNPENLVNYLGE